MKKKMILDRCDSHLSHLRISLSFEIFLDLVFSIKDITSEYFKKYFRTYKDTIAILDKFKKYLMFRYYFNMTKVPLYILNGKIQDDFNFRCLQNNVFGIVKPAGFFLFSTI